LTIGSIMLRYLHLVLETAQSFRISLLQNSPTFSLDAEQAQE